MNRLFIEIIKIDDSIETTLESFITLFVYKTLNNRNNIELNLINSNRRYVDSNTIIAGLCSVCRGIIKSSLLTYPTDEFLNDLLGFKQACLLSPTESSIWTKFCEIEIINCVKYFYNTFQIDNHTNEILLPEEFAKFECHMSQPVKTHNVYKLARDLAKLEINLKLNENSEETTTQKESKEPRLNKRKTNKKKKVIIESGIPIVDLKIEHKFCETSKLTLADLILFTSYYLIFDLFNENLDQQLPIPLTLKWFHVIKEFDNNKFNIIFNDLHIRNKKRIELIDITFKIDLLNKFSLYKNDCKRYKPRNRIFTRQQDLENSLNKIQKLNVEISSENLKTEGREKNNFNWENIPFDALPEGGQLPPSRLNRKKEQLENLLIEVINLSKPNDFIVDFCSGTGHLGILLAYKLPNCKIILVENKEESLNIAKERSKKLKLNNILFYQCNLDYFTLSFNIGTSLHACGVATDIVLQSCLKAKASFVCSPCCYGKIQEMPHITYPLSKLYNEINLIYFDYLFIAHCADQNHDVDVKNCNIDKSIQGEYCMDIIDTDRKLSALEHGYTVILTRMIPEKCSPKNRLLIGKIKGDDLE